MPGPFTQLTLYRIRNDISGRPVEGPDDIIDGEKEHTTHELVGRFDFSAKLYVAKPDERFPGWVEVLKSGFPKLKASNNVSNSAVLVVSVKHDRRDCYFAFTFGFGRFLLKSGAYERNYGMRVALNAIYPAREKNQELDAIRLRSVDSKTVAANTLRTRRQADRRTAFETFDVDIQRDLLTGLTGAPWDNRTWGLRITGADALYLTCLTPFEQLGSLCRHVETTYQRSFPEEFSWVDNIRLVRGAELNTLRTRALEILTSEDVSSFELAPPELVEWGPIGKFGFSFDPEPESRFDEPELAHYIEALNRKNKLKDLTVDQLASHRLEAFDQGDQKIHQWPVFKCLSGELKLKNKTYLLSEGDFFEVAPDYLAELDAYLGALKEYSGSLEESVKKGEKWEDEGVYNARASEPANYLLLDKRTVRLRSKTTPIEVCDILSTDGHFIHVKRKLNSSSLSHLFSQGLVSADLLLMSQEFRNVMLAQIKKAEQLKGTRVNGFSNLFRNGVQSPNFEVVYAIIDSKWRVKTTKKERTLQDALPFFSKVNLRRCSEELRKMGYRVTYKRVLAA